MTSSDGNTTVPDARDYSILATPDQSSSLFFVAPEEFLGNKGTSYGGYFNFSYLAEFREEEQRREDNVYVWLIVSTHSAYTG